ncbi:DUF6233 domain-containing protein [Streptomyces sp. NBC_01537]|uniref:DUF6233 domain-containing protein n=1 Tax=Streptomyces sp. NBC_01537 TaxID=2903896 RepID=UPI0038706368
MRNREGLPDADGPLVRLELPDHQHVCAVVRKRRQEPDGSWFYWVELPLCAVAEACGRFTAQPSPSVFAAPAAACTPIEGQDYSGVPTERLGRTPAWQIEQHLEAGAPVPWVVHRGDCHAGRGSHRAADDRQALAVLAQGDAMACPVCRPDRVLLLRR